MDSPSSHHPFLPISETMPLRRKECGQTGIEDAEERHSPADLSGSGQQASPVPTLPLCFSRSREPVHGDKSARSPQLSCDVRAGEPHLTQAPYFMSSRVRHVSCTQVREQETGGVTELVNVQEAVTRQVPGRKVGVLRERISSRGNSTEAGRARQRKPWKCLEERLQG